MPPYQAALRAAPVPASFAMNPITACVTSPVVAVPPRSRVCSAWFDVTLSIARITSAAALFSPRCSSSITTDQNVPTGFAKPLPMMSKAEPWIGSNIDG